MLPKQLEEIIDNGKVSLFRFCCSKINRFRSDCIQFLMNSTEVQAEMITQLDILIMHYNVSCIVQSKRYVTNKKPFRVEKTEIDLLAKVESSFCSQTKNGNLN